MSRTYKITLLLLISLLVALAYLEASEPEEINWNPSYSAVDKIPLGSYVLYENLQEQLPETRIVNIPPYEFLADTSSQGTYFFLNNHLSFDKSELKRLFKWVEKGNTAFIIADSFSENLLDTLGIRTKLIVPKKGISSKPLFNLKNSQLEREIPYFFDKETYHSVFSEYDSLQQEVLGITALYEDELEIATPKVNFLRDSLGKGALYLHSNPKAFSNFFLLAEEGNEQYVEGSLAYLQPQNILFWDSYYKAGKTFNTSPLFVLLRSRHLKWAYYILIAGALLFLYFEGKRKQRSIPVIEPLKNQTYHFTRTVAGLFIDSKDYKGIATKKINLFLDYLRTKYRIDTSEKRDNFFERLGSLSNTPATEVKQLWNYMNRLNEQKTVSKEELIQLNKAINAFKKNKNGK